MESKRGKKIGIIGSLMVALGMSAGGCYMTHGPYIDVRVTKPHFGRPAPGPAQVRYNPDYVVEEQQPCTAYAATAGDSMHPNGRRVVVCPSQGPYGDVYVEQ